MSQRREQCPGRRQYRVVAAITISLVGVAACSVAPVTAAPSAEPDLKVSESASAASVLVNSPLTYTIGIENLGPESATGVTVIDHLPRGVSYTSSSSMLGACALQGRKVVCALGTLESGALAKVSSATVTLEVVPRISGTVTDTATVSGDQKDPVPANNRASATTTILAPAPTATCHGVPATIVGTNGADTLVGTNGRDVIVGLGGNDTIRSLGGNDLICAGGGNDFVASGPGADRVFGGPGRDRLLGRRGRDLLVGGRGNDVLKGGAGGDRLRGGAGFDICRPGPGHRPRPQLR